MGKTYEARGGKFGCKGVNEVEWGGRKVGGRIYSATPEYCWRTRSLVCQQYFFTAGVPGIGIASSILWLEGPSSWQLLLATQISGTPAVKKYCWRTRYLGHQQ